MDQSVPINSRGRVILKCSSDTRGSERTEAKTTFPRNDLEAGCYSNSRISEVNEKRIRKWRRLQGIPGEGTKSTRFWRHVTMRGFPWLLAAAIMLVSNDQRC